MVTMVVVGGGGQHESETYASRFHIGILQYHECHYKTSLTSSIDSIIHGLETREITEFHPRFDFRKLFDLQVSCRCLHKGVDKFFKLGGLVINKPSYPN